MITDTHCHIDDLTDLEIKEMLERAKTVNVQRMITIATSRAEFARAQELAENNKEIFFALGVHPGSKDDFNTNVYSDILEISKHPKCLGIGETGLDYSYRGINKGEQKNNFIEHMKICDKIKLPLIIHNRDSDEDMMKIVDENYSGNYPIIIHCFSASLEFAKWAVEREIFISISGIVTFKNGQNVRDAVEVCPIDKLLVETDSPYLAPVPYRGKKCEPTYVAETFKKVAELKGLSEEELEKQLEENVHRCFGNKL